jgi:ribonuclease HI
MNLIITDGGNKEGTYGSYRIFDSRGNLLAKQSYYWGIGDHNQAEYWILLNALDKALTIGLKDAIIFTDSETVVKQVIFERPLHAQKLKKIRSLVLERLERFERWEIRHVSRVLIKTFLGH